MAVLAAGKQKVGASVLGRAKMIARRYHDSGRAQILLGYMEVEHARSLASVIDRRQCLRRALAVVGDAAEHFGHSLVIALFHAQILFALGEHDAAESECRRALAVEDPADPNEDDIPPGSVIGAEKADRVSSVKKRLRGLLLVKSFCQETSKMQGTFLPVRIDALLEHYGKIDLSIAWGISDAVGYVKEYGLWSSWICPNCCGGRKFLDSGSLLQHICESHFHLEEPLPERLRSELDQKLTDNKSDGDYSLEEITLCEDSDGPDVFCFNNANDLFECLSHSPFRRTEADPFVEVQEMKCRKGSEILQDIKEKLKTSGSDEFDKSCHVIQDLWLKFLRGSVLDYREVILPLARSFQWRELKKRMTEDEYIAVRNIDKADIDTIFVNVADEQSAEEMESISCYRKTLDVLNKYNCDEDLLVLNVFIQSLWNLRYFRDGCPRRSLVCFQSSHDDSYICIADKLFEIFSAWEKNEQRRMAFLLTTMKTALSRILNEKNVKNRSASEIVATILKELHMSETPLHFYFNCMTERQEIDPINCSDCICQAHDLFGLKFHVEMSCQCMNPYDEKEYSTFFHKLIVGSPEITKIKSFSELPVLLDEQLCCKDVCNFCGNLKLSNHILSNTPHFFTIVLNWLGGSKNQDAFSELLGGITSPFDINLLYKGVHSAAKYSLASMVIHNAGRNNELFDISWNPLSSGFCL